MPTPEPPDRSQAADAIDGFLASVSTWLGWYKLVRTEEDLAAGLNPIDSMPVVKALLEPFVVPNLSPEIEAATAAEAQQRAAHRAFEFTGKQNEQGARVRDAGRALAITLESLGIDSTPVLTIVHCTEAHGGGPAYMLPRWEDLKGRLRRVAIQFRTVATRHRVGEAPEESVTASSSGPAVPPGAIKEVASLTPATLVDLFDSAKFRNDHDKPWTVAAIKRRVDRAATGRACKSDRLRLLDQALLKAKVPGRYLFSSGPLKEALEEIVRGCATRDQQFDDLLRVLQEHRDLQGS